MRKHLIHGIACMSLAAFAITLPGGVCVAGGVPHHGQAALRRSLKTLPYKIAYECYVNGNWEIFIMNADGSNKVNLTRTPNRHEHYPQISPDGARIAFTVDEGEGRDAVRSLWVMDINGKHARKI